MCRHTLLNWSNFNSICFNLFWKLNRLHWTKAILIWNENPPTVQCSLTIPAQKVSTLISLIITLKTRLYLAPPFRKRRPEPLLRKTVRILYAYCMYLGNIMCSYFKSLINLKCIEFTSEDNSYESLAASEIFSATLGKKDLQRQETFHYQMTKWKDWITNLVSTGFLDVSFLSVIVLQGSCGCILI